jgi:hypothetical protein
MVGMGRGKAAFGNAPRLRNQRPLGATFIGAKYYCIVSV